MMDLTYGLQFADTYLDDPAVEILVPVASENNKCLENNKNNVKEETTPFKGLILMFSLVAQSCPTLCDPMNCSTPGLPVHHQLLQFTQTHVHQVTDAIQSSHPLLAPSPPAPSPSQHQSLFQ